MRHLNLPWLLRMAWRDSRTYRSRLLFFTLSISVGIAALVAMRALADGMESQVNEQSNALLGADAVVSGSRPFPAEVESLLLELGGPQSRQVSFSSMIVFPRSGASRLVQVRALEGDFPYYGQFETQPASGVEAFRRDDGALVDHVVMLQYGLAVGDTVKIGRVFFPIVGRLQRIPGEVAAISSLEPRVYIPMAFLEDTKLVQQGSRLSYAAMLKLEGTEAPKSLGRLKEGLEDHNLRLETVKDRQRNLGRSLDNLYRFLNLGSFVALLLGSVGVASAIHAYVRQKLDTIAVLRSIGATTAQAFLVYLFQATAMGAFGAAVGVVLGLGVLALLPTVLGDFLPFAVDFRVSPAPVLQGVGVGLGLTVLFAALPLLGIRGVSPLRALRASYETARPLYKDPWGWFVYLLIGGAIIAFSLSQNRSSGRGLAFAAGLALAFGVLAVVAWALTRGSRRFFPHNWSYVWRQGLANLYRPHNQTLMLILALGLGTFLLTTLYLVQGALLGNIERISGGEKPNMVLLDIQSDQVDAVAALTQKHGLPLLEQVPVVAMRIQSINGQSVEELMGQGHRRGNWALRREYRVTYRDSLSASEELIAGTWRGRVESPEDSVFISIDHSFAPNMGVDIGDEIVFDVQGVPLTTYVGNLRSVNWQRIKPNFLVLFPAGVLEPAPQFHVFVTRTPDKENSALFQREAVRLFPNVSVIDLDLVLSTIDDILGKVSLVIRFMALFSVAIGLIVLLGVIGGSRYQRVQESVLLRTLGAVRGQVIRIALAEYLLLGFFSAFSGLLLAWGGTWALSTFVFNIPFTPQIVPALLVVAGVSGATVLVGGLASRGIHDRPPLEVLRGAE
jgi:putative ABC transport system permease protein